MLHVIEYDKVAKIKKSISIKVCVFSFTGNAFFPFMNSIKNGLMPSVLIINILYHFLIYGIEFVIFTAQEFNTSPTNNKFS